MNFPLLGKRKEHENPCSLMTDLPPSMQELTELQKRLKLDELNKCDQALYSQYINSIVKQEECDNIAKLIKQEPSEEEFIPLSSSPKLFTREIDIHVDLGTQLFPIKEEPREDYEQMPVRGEEVYNEEFVSHKHCDSTRPEENSIND